VLRDDSGNDDDQVIAGRSLVLLCEFILAVSWSSG
jgi:hypothetical protein